ncbi:hypothetical protein [Microbacterium sp. No. 7]|uniref:hypothetical protein n=1 Tax=Microbacterium sp. No. 7 TaxID=1714373 RepID=UPI003FA582DB
MPRPATAARPGSTTRARALLTTDVVRWVTAEGLVVDVASGGELAVAPRGGSGPCPPGPPRQQQAAVRDQPRGSGRRSAPSSSTRSSRCERIAAEAESQGRVQTVLIRVNSGVHAETHDFLATAHEDQKFGFALTDAEAAVARIRELPSLRFAGLHCTAARRSSGPAGFADPPLVSWSCTLGSARRRRSPPEPSAAASASPIRPRTTRPRSRSSPTASSRRSRASARAAASRCPSSPRAGPHHRRTAGVTLYRVGTVKPVRVSDDLERLYVSVDGGMSDNARTALYGADYSARIASRRSDSAPALTRVVGRHCEAATSWCRTSTSPVTSSPATSSPSRRRAPIASRSRATTTT